jgi:hypothetical protein
MVIRLGSPTTKYLDFLPTTKAVGSTIFGTNGFSRWSTMLHNQRL